MKVKNSVINMRMLCGVLMLGTAIALSACGSKEKSPSQVLVQVNGKEITVLQVNEELQNTAVRPAQQEEMTQQLLKLLIDRQLILEEAERNKINRTPEVMRAIERSKEQVIVQAYLQSIASKVAKPLKAEIDEYYQKHPEFFAHRKEFDLRQLLIANKSYSEGLKTFIDSAKTLDEIAGWMDKRGVVYVRRQVTRSTSDLPKQAVAQLEILPLGQLFLVDEGDNKVLNVLAAIRSSPILATNAAPQIEQFLTNKTTKEMVEEEIKLLRSLAKIEYLNASAPVATQTVVTTPDKAIETK
ncbi:MAG: EpsD family peptidyl-prolyl cis-trans isomerase [Candidatus Nitrotoga sp.]